MTFAILGVGAAVSIVLCMWILPQPTGSVAFCAIMAAQEVRFGMLVWRRMALPYSAAGSVVGAIGFAVLAAGSLRGHGMAQGWSMETLVGMTCFAIGGVLSLVEARTHPGALLAWREAVGRATPWDVLSMRAIPDLRNATPQG